MLRRLLVQTRLCGSLRPRTLPTEGLPFPLQLMLRLAQPVARAEETFGRQRVGVGDPRRARTQGSICDR